LKELKMKTTKPILDPKVPERRTFLKTLGFTGGAAFLGSTVSNRVVAETRMGPAGRSADVGRRPMVLLHSSNRRSPDSEFVRTCEAVISAGARRDLDTTVARLCHPFQVYLRDVKDAESWLEGNGYFRSLDYYVGNGGRQVVLFHQLDRVTEPQYGICRKSLAYISFALRRRYSNQTGRRLYTMFPGPSERLGSNGFYRYFEHYDFLTNHRRPRTFVQVFGKNVDPLIQNRTMLDHGARGVFDSVALCYESGTATGSSSSSLDDIGTIHYLKWFKDSVDDRVFLYQSERADAGKCQVRKGTREWEEYAAGRGLIPYEFGCSHYYFHAVA
jgi:hypothetical protein